MESLAADCVSLYEWKIPSNAHNKPAWNVLQRHDSSMYNLFRSIPHDLWRQEIQRPKFVVISPQTPCRGLWMVRPKRKVFKSRSTHLLKFQTSSSLTSERLVLLFHAYTQMRSPRGRLRLFTPRRISPFSSLQTIQCFGISSQLEFYLLTLSASFNTCINVSLC